MRKNADQILYWIPHPVKERPSIWRVLLWLLVLELLVCPSALVLDLHPNVCPGIGEQMVPCLRCPCMAIDVLVRAWICAEAIAGLLRDAGRAALFVLNPSRRALDPEMGQPTAPRAEGGLDRPIGGAGRSSPRTSLPSSRGRRDVQTSRVPPAWQAEAPARGRSGRRRTERGHRRKARYGGRFFALPPERSAA